MNINQIELGITPACLGHFYIGSAANLSQRWSSHKDYLRRRKHHNPHLQNAWDKYGPDSFEFIVLEIV